MNTEIHNETGTFSKEIEALRKKMLNAIIKRIAMTGLTKVNLEDPDLDRIYVVRFAKNGDPAECEVKAVSIHEHIPNNIILHARDTVTDKDVTISSVYELGAKNPDWLNEIFERLCNVTELVYQMVRDHDIDTSRPFCRSSDQSFEWSEDPGKDFTVFDGLAVSKDLKVQLVFPKVREITEDDTRLDEFIKATDNIRGSSFKTTARDADPYMIMYTGFETGWTKTFKSTKA